MSTINIDLRAVAGNAEQVLLNSLNHVGSGDVVNITMDRRQAHEADNVFTVLAHEGFEVMPRGGPEETYSIVAHRRPN